MVAYGGAIVGMVVGSLLERQVRGPLGAVAGAGPTGTAAKGEGGPDAGDGRRDEEQKGGV